MLVVRSTFTATITVLSSMIPTHFLMGDAASEYVGTALNEGDREVVAPDRWAVGRGQVHDRGYVDFLGTAWDRWVALGHGLPAAMAFGWPAPRCDVRPESFEASSAYSFAADCSRSRDLGGGREHRRDRTHRCCGSPADGA